MSGLKLPQLMDMNDGDEGGVSSDIKEYAEARLAVSNSDIAANVKALVRMIQELSSEVSSVKASIVELRALVVASGNETAMFNPKGTVSADAEDYSRLDSESVTSGMSQSTRVVGSAIRPLALKGSNDATKPPLKFRAEKAHTTTPLSAVDPIREAISAAASRTKANAKMSKAPEADLHGMSEEEYMSAYFGQDSYLFGRLLICLVTSVQASMEQTQRITMGGSMKGYLNDVNKLIVATVKHSDMTALPKRSALAYRSVARQLRITSDSLYPTVAPITFQSMARSSLTDDVYRAFTTLVWNLKQVGEAIPYPGNVILGALQTPMLIDSGFNVNYNTRLPVTQNMIGSGSTARIFGIPALDLTHYVYSRLRLGHNSEVAKRYAISHSKVLGRPSARDLKRVKEECDDTASELEVVDLDE